MELDAYDKQLLYLLDKDASISLAELAKKLRRSKPFILHRMKRLEQEGIVTGYYAIVDMSRLGFFTFRIYLDLQKSTWQDRLEMVEFIKTLPNVWTIGTLHGKWDLAAFIGVKTIPEFHAVWDQIKLRYKDKIKQYKIAIYAPVYNYNRTFFMDKLEKNDLKEERVYGIGVPEEVEELDWRILQAYAPAVRQSSLELAKKLQVSPDTIRSHIRNLRKRQVIVGYKIGLNLSKLGYDSYRVDFDLMRTDKVKDLFLYCQVHKSVYQINNTIGGADFEIEVVVRNAEELTQFIDSIKTKFKDMIRDDDHFRFSTIHLLNYIPD